MPSISFIIKQSTRIHYLNCNQQIAINNISLRNKFKCKTHRIASHCDWMMTVSSWNIQQKNLFTIGVEWQLNNKCWNFIFTLTVFKRNNIKLVSDLQRYTSLHMSSYLIFHWCILYFLCVIYISFGFIHLLRKSMRKYIHYSCNLSNYIQCTGTKKKFHCYKLCKFNVDVISLHQVKFELQWSVKFMYFYIQKCSQKWKY